MQGTDGPMATDTVSPGGTHIADDEDPAARTSQQSPTTLVSEFTIRHEDLVLTPTMRALPAVSIRLDRPTAGGPEGKYLFFTAEGTHLEDFEATLDDDGTIDEVTVIGRFDDHHVYRVLIAQHAMTVSSVLSALAVRIIDVESDGDAWRLRVQLPDRGRLLEFSRHCLDRGITFRVRKLLAPDGASPELRVDLTEHQRGTLLAALEGGYYDVPRRVSQEQLAEHLGVSTSAISQRLRLATGQLLEATIATDGDT